MDSLLNHFNKIEFYLVCNWKTLNSVKHGRNIPANCILPSSYIVMIKFIFFSKMPVRIFRGLKFEAYLN